ncbi:TAP-like protein-domain-containing protein [Rhizoctonia solani]|nr:TAP-like protein-domain-containing protein [Rhizoctonia solani]
MTRRTSILGLTFALYLAGSCDGASLRNQTLLESRGVGDVEWYQCPNITDLLIECGTIVVPLDYSDPNAGTATIALGKYKAQVSPKKGTVFLGAGGPGDLGQLLAIDAGEFFSTMRVGTDYDIIGFDSRGMGSTTPTVTCFKSREEKDTFYRNTVFELGYTQPPNVNKDPFARFDLVQQYRQAISMFETQAKLCTLNMPDGGASLKYMGTSTVARDIEYMSRVITGADTPINYYGGSYGSILGSYLVNMFPERVGRVVIDGVADPISWTTKHSYEWIDGWLNQTEADYDWFLRACIQAGPTKCALATENNTVEGLKTVIETFLNQLYYHPLASPNSTMPAYLTSGAARSSLFLGIMRPRTWPTIAENLKKAMNGDPTAIMNDLVPNQSRLVADKGDLYRYAVTCLDSLPFDGPSTWPTAETLADEAINRIRKVSPHFGISATLSEPDGGCEFWPAKGAERFTGPWNHTLAYPVLIASTMVDPITPLTSAKLVNKLLGNSSRLLIQNNAGHVTLSGVSTCTAKVFLAYFGNGTLPEDGSICETDTQPFGLSSPVNATKEVMELSKKMEELHNKLALSRRWF